MSIKAINEAFKSKLNGNQKLVLLALADCADDNMQCFPSYSHLAKKASISLSTAKRIISKLDELKVIRKNNRFKKGKKAQTSNLYTLTINSMIKTQDTIESDTILVSPMTQGDSITAMTPESSSSLIITHSSDEKEVERDFLDFKNDIVEKNENKIFIILEKNKFSIKKYLLQRNGRTLGKDESFSSWRKIYENKHLINEKLNTNLNYKNVGKFVDLGENKALILDIQNDYYVIEIGNEKKLIRIEEARILND